MCFPVTIPGCYYLDIVINDYSSDIAEQAAHRVKVIFKSLYGPAGLRYKFRDQMEFEDSEEIHKVSLLFHVRGTDKEYLHQSVYDS